MKSIFEFNNLINYLIINVNSTNSYFLWLNMNYLTGTVWWQGTSIAVISRFKAALMWQEKTESVRTFSVARASFFHRERSSLDALRLRYQKVLTTTEAKRKVSPISEYFAVSRASATAQRLRRQQLKRSNY